jgi:hypothetical protein
MQEQASCITCAVLSMPRVEACIVAIEADANLGFYLVNFESDSINLVNAIKHVRLS